MAKVILICGKICSGKTTYAKKLCRKTGAVLLSVDEIMLSMFGMYAGEMHDEYARRTREYLLEKSTELIGAGIDVDVLKRCYKAKYLKGSLNYLVSLIITVIFLKFYQFSATLNGKNGEHNGLIVCACNGRRFGGGMSICPDAAFDDGLLDVVLVENVTRPMVPGALVHLATGKILKWKNTLHERAPRLQVQFHPAATIQIDGELYDDLPFDVQIVHNQLKMYRR